MLGGLVGLLVLAIAAVYIISEMHFNRTYQVQVKPVAIPTDAASIAYGKHLACIRGCQGCHGDHLFGQIEFQDPLLFCFLQ